MKTLPTLLSLLLASSALSPGQGAKAQGAIRDAATDDELAARLHRVQSTDPMKKFTPSEGKDPSKENQPTDLLSRSDMLSFNGMATLVPKGSILVTPPLLSDRVGMKSGLKIVTWLEFYSVNRGWIATQEITLPQAEGKTPLDEKVTENLRRSSNLVVATLQGGPISKLAPQPAAQPEPQPAAGTANR